MTVQPHDDDERRLLEGLGRGPDGRSSAIPSGLGAPAWVAATHRHCSKCGGPLVFARVPDDERPRDVCAACGHISYVNPRMVVTTLPITESGEIVLLRRGIQPGYGTWSQPGGFLEVDETVTEAAIRETFEETGLIVEPGSIVGLYARLEAAVVVLVYEARVLGGSARTNPEALEIVAFPPHALPWAEIGFETTRWALRDWLGSHRPDVDVR